ncbi:MAG: glycerol-3-phosphate 1-O-acyltransferase PlsY [Clostridiales Family XIII bacterium]|nr:glycerol-3-phosphate 1-O-acyltransferase PlsY [Clostridiales Family XIII bacterium]
MMKYISDSFLAKLPETPGSLPLLIVGVIAAYFLGNINPAIIIGRIYGVDVRSSGSGNPGSTNVVRTIGSRAGAITFTVDIMKGYIPVIVAMRFAGAPYALLCGFAVIVGHMFPAFYGFKGGKGVATTFGVLLAINWYYAILLIAMFGLTTLFFKMVSLSVLCAIVFAIPLSTVLGTIYPLWVVLVCILIVIKHRGNIVRIAKREEPTLSFRRKE